MHVVFSLDFHKSIGTEKEAVLAWVLFKGD